MLQSTPSHQGLWAAAASGWWLLTLPAFAADAVRHSFIAADSSRHRLAIIDESGQTTWETHIGPLHDVHVLHNGHILFQKNWTHVVEMDPRDQRVVWEYDAAKAGDNAGKRVEVHAFQRLVNGHTMLAESGSARIIEVDGLGKLMHHMPLRVAKPHPHHDTRLVRKLENGHYLVCHEADGLVCEYAPDGQTVWEYAVPLFGKEPAAGHGPEAFGNQCFAALRLASGNTLVSTGNGHRVIEVSPDQQIVWQLEETDLSGIQLAWITSLQVLPSGNILFVNCHAGEHNPQLIEVTRDKQLVWQFKDFERFGNSLTNAQILTTNSQPVFAQLGAAR